MREETEQALTHSNAFLAIVSEGFLTDPKCQEELNLAIYQNKPILLLVEKEVSLPAWLVTKANGIEVIDRFDDSDALKKATIRLLKKLN